MVKLQKSVLKLAKQNPEVRKILIEKLSSDKSSLRKDTIKAQKIAEQTLKIVSKDQKKVIQEVSKIFYYMQKNRPFGSHQYGLYISEISNAANNYYKTLEKFSKDSKDWLEKDSLFQDK